MKETTGLYALQGQCGNIELWQVKKVIIKFFGDVDDEIYFRQEGDVVEFRCEDIPTLPNREEHHNQILEALKKYNNDVFLHTNWVIYGSGTHEEYGSIRKIKRLRKQQKFVDPNPMSPIRFYGSLFVLGFILLSFFVHPIVICESGAHCVMFARNLTLTDPTYDEMVSFVANDYTELNEYDARTYNCEDFTEDVIINARSQGYKVGYVFIEGYDTTSDYTYVEGRSGHAIVCFKTTDKGLYFLEPQLDVLMSEAEMDTMSNAGCYCPSLGDEYFSIHMWADPEINWCHFVLSQILGKN